MTRTTVWNGRRLRKPATKSVIAGTDVRLTLGPRRRFTTSFLMGGAVLALLVVLALLAPVIAPYDPLKIAPVDRLQAPSWEHFFGTDAFGRDLFSRVLVGARSSLAVSVLAVVLAAVPGILFGVWAGMNPGLLEGFFTRVMDAWIAVPGLLLAIVMTAALGRSMLVLAVALGLVGISTYYRQARVETLRVNSTQYVEAARSLGGREWHIILYHVLPNVLPALLVLISIRIAGLLLAVGALGFIGLGVPPPTPEWGSLMAEGRDYLRQAWWLTLYPGLAIAVTVFNLNLVGDGLRDVLDPRQKSLRG